MMQDSMQSNRKLLKEPYLKTDNHDRDIEDADKDTGPYEGQELQKGP